MKFNKSYLIGAAFSASFLLIGCESNNVKTYQPDIALKYRIPVEHMCRVHVKSVSMRQCDDNNMICRMAGNIYLPNKITYAQYIKDGFEKSLMAMDKYSNTESGAKNLSVNLNDVSFCSVAGEWRIQGDVRIGNSVPVSIKSVTEFGTAFNAARACRNTADAFDGAVADFIKQTLTHKTIARNLETCN